MQSRFRPAHKPVVPSRQLPARVASPLQGEKLLRPPAMVERARSVSMPIAFLGFSIHRDSMGQQHRVRIKRKRRLAYLRRKNASLRAAAARPAPAKQQALKETVAAE